MNAMASTISRSPSSAVAAVAAAGLLGLAAPGQAGTISKTNTTGGLADGSSFTRNITFTAADLGSETIITDLDVTIDFAKYSNTVPGWSGLADIEFVLTSPAGTSFTLVSNKDGTEIVAADAHDSLDAVFSTNFDSAVTFDQSAAQPVNANRKTITPGTFRPDDATQGSLDLFNGESALGTFSLFIEDDYAGNPLRFDAFTLDITTTAAAVPEPTAALGATAMFGLATLRRRRRAAV
jgi:MYXO-CTERM domain-containing protein